MNRYPSGGVSIKCILCEIILTGRSGEPTLFEMKHFFIRCISGGCLLILTAALSGCATGINPVHQRAGEVQLKQAQEYRHQGLDEQALVAFESALKDNPALYEAHLGIGDILRERGDYAVASRSYQQAATIAPNSFNAQYYYGLMQHLLGRVKPAVRIYLRALAINPDSFDANLNLGSAYLQLGSAAEALPYANRATQLNANHQLAWANLAAVYSHLQRYSAAVNAYRQAVELGELAEPILLGLANAHIQLGHYDRSINVLQSLNRRSPSATAYERLGYAQFKMRRFDESLASFRAALSLNRDDTAALNGLGVCLMTMFLQSGRALPAQRNEALDAWRRSVQLRSDQPKIIDLLTRYQRL